MSNNARSDVTHKLMVFVVPAITFSLLLAAVLMYGLIISNPFQLW
ncbi:MAG: hypothetical protein VKJ04_01665 [Vampirovibrionales bacterium]|nr:hypothetical protein [Vampirovibrionales bacterium]